MLDAITLAKEVAAAVQQFRAAGPASEGKRPLPRQRPKV
jgi:hypothetical protein